MAKFEDSMDILMGLEFSSSANALEKNSTETGYTYMGIYETAHRNWKGWNIIYAAVDGSANLRDTSRSLYKNEELTEMVYDFYFDTFWKPYRLNEIEEQHKADELFVFGVNAGMKKAIKLVQDLVGCSVDGVIGSQTIKAINESEFSFFDQGFDDEEIEYYKSLVQANPKKSIFLNGWINRAKAV